MPVRTRARTAHTAKSSWRASVRAILAVHLVHQQPQIEAERGQQDDVAGRHRVEQHGDVCVYAIEVLTVLEAQRRKSFRMDEHVAAVARHAAVPAVRRESRHVDDRVAQEVTRPEHSFVGAADVHVRLQSEKPAADHREPPAGVARGGGRLMPCRVFPGNGWTRIERERRDWTVSAPQLEMLRKALRAGPYE